MADTQYTKIASPFPADWQPAYVSLALEQVLRVASAILGLPVYIGQPPYNTRNKASAGTHDKRNCVDIYGRKGHEKADLERWQKVLRLLGWPGWVRNPKQGNWPWHLHFFKHGDPGLANLALEQDIAYVDGYNGLGYKGKAGKDYGFRPRDPEVFHVYKRTDVFKVRSATGGYSQARKDADLKLKVRQPGFMITNHGLTVSDKNGKLFIVTKTGTFYDRQKLTAVR